MTGQTPGLSSGSALILMKPSFARSFSALSGKWCKQFTRFGDQPRATPAAHMAYALRALRFPGQRVSSDTLASVRNRCSSLLLRFCLARATAPWLHPSTRKPSGNHPETIQKPSRNHPETMLALACPSAIFRTRAWVWALDHKPWVHECLCLKVVHFVRKASGIPWSLKLFPSAPHGLMLCSNPLRLFPKCHVGCQKHTTHKLRRESQERPLKLAPGLVLHLRHLELMEVRSVKPDS